MYMPLHSSGSAVAYCASTQQIQGTTTGVSKVDAAFHPFNVWWYPNKPVRQPPDRNDHFCVMVMLRGYESECHDFCPPYIRHFFGDPDVQRGR
ncbi:hypothetical protein TNCV_603021 [Trichonephila clavipes]|nr:hypothetical protein TNCV_603021 [Trichonephila clavipes]